MKKRVIDFDKAKKMKNGYIPAPYELEEGEQINDFYLEPVIFQNENGPAIGVTTCGVIVQDGLYFKDMDNSKKLDPYKDWRLGPRKRSCRAPYARAAGRAGIKYTVEYAAFFDCRRSHR